MCGSLNVTDKLVSSQIPSAIYPYFHLSYSQLLIYSLFTPSYFVIKDLIFKVQIIGRFTYMAIEIPE